VLPFTLQDPRVVVRVVTPHDTAVVRVPEVDVAIGRVGYTPVLQADPHRSKYPLITVLLSALTTSPAGTMLSSCIDLHGKTAPDQQLVHHVIVRSDIPTGMQVANATHAAGESADPRPFPGTIAVALQARDEQHLRQVADSLSRAGIRHALVIEGDGSYTNQLMAIGVNPTTDRAAVRKVLSSLPLVK
jgi:hypothetical protein